MTTAEGVSHQTQATVDADNSRPGHPKSANSPNVQSDRQAGYESPFVQPAAYLRTAAANIPNAMTPVHSDHAIDWEEKQGLVGNSFLYLSLSLCPFFFFFFFLLSSHVPWVTLDFLSTEHTGNCLFAGCLGVGACALLFFS